MAPQEKYARIQAYFSKPPRLFRGRGIPIFNRFVLSLVAVLGFCGASAFAVPVTVVEEEAEANFDLRAVLKVGNAKAPLDSAAIFLGYQADEPYLAVGFSRDALTLSRVEDGETTILTTVKQNYAPPAAEGTPVVIQWRSGSLRVVYDRRILLRAEKLGVLKGGVAITPQKGNVRFAEPAFQPVEPVHFSDDFMRSATVPGLWEPASGTWKLNTSGDPNLGANPFSYVSKGKDAKTLTGGVFWSDYVAAVSVKPAGDEALGLILNWQDDKNYLLCKWYGETSAGRRTSKKQLWRVLRGKATLIAAAPGGYRAQQWYRLAASAANGTFKMMVDGATVLEKKTDLFGGGKAGLFSDGNWETMFDDVEIRPADEIAAPQIDQVAQGPARFAQDQSMEDWASPKGQWLPSPDAPATFWNRGMFFGDLAVDAKVTALTAGAQAEVLLGGDGQNTQSAYAFRIKPAADGKGIQAVLLRAGKATMPAKTLAMADATTARIKLQRAGNVIRGLVGDAVVASFTDARPLAGRRAGYSTSVAQIAVADAHISGGNMLDYTFYNAPTDWRVESGNWDTASRWICTPTWTWYAGWSDRVASVWNKRSFSGDFAIEVFASSKMDLATAPYYLHPRDLNITIAGDGRDLSSGYSLIFGGWNNTFTRILRGTKTVAETDKILLPTSAQYHGAAHHKWFCLRVEKVGDTISYYIDRKLALQYKDPKPLDGKRIALWTSGNGMMVARATIYYQKQNGAEPPPGIFDVADDLNLAPSKKLNWQVRGGDAAVSLAAIAPAKIGGRSGVRVLNIGGGGNFAVSPQTEAFDALKTPKLTFQARLNKGTQINLYLRVKDIYHAVRLSGPAQDEEDAKNLGAFAIAADDKWHDVDLDLAAMLKPLYPTDTQLMIDEIFLGNLARDPYRQAGFGANYPGTSYLIRYFALRSPDNKLAKLIEPQLQAAATPQVPKIGSH